MITGETMQEGQEKVRQCQKSSEWGSMILNVDKSEILVSSKQEGDTIVMQDRRGQALKKEEKLKYLVFTI